MNAVVFAGPTLHGVSRDRLTGIDLRPPAQCGDILAAVNQGATAIGLIDGLFETKPSPWHKEILAALDAGVRLHGAASLGALRAAECDGFGMVGIGRIYEDYRDGRRVSDADVAVVHAPAELGFAPLSVALVDIDVTLDRLRSKGLIDPESASRLANAAETTFFKDRTWKAVTERAGLPNLLQTLEGAAFSQKTSDAMLLLEAMRNLPAIDRSAANRLPVPFSRTGFAAMLMARIERRAGSPPASV